MATLHHHIQDIGYEHVFSLNTKASSKKLSTRKLQPNAETLRSFHDAENNIDITRCSSIEELFAKLNLGDDDEAG